MDVSRASEGSLTAAPSLFLHSALKQEERKEGDGEFLREDSRSVELATQVAQICLQNAWYAQCYTREVACTL